MRRYLSLLVFIGLVWGQTNAGGEFGYEIKLRVEGRVLDKNNKEVSGVKVQIKYGTKVITETKTNAKGRFKITGKHNFSFEERASRSGSSFGFKSKETYTLFVIDSLFGSNSRDFKFNSKYNLGNFISTHFFDKKFKDITIIENKKIDFKPHRDVTGKIILADDSKRVSKYQNKSFDNINIILYRRDQEPHRVVKPSLQRKSVTFV